MNLPTPKPPKPLPCPNGQKTFEPDTPGNLWLWRHGAKFRMVCDTCGRKVSGFTAQAALESWNHTGDQDC